MPRVAKAKTEPEVQVEAPKRRGRPKKVVGAKQSPIESFVTSRFDDVRPVKNIVRKPIVIDVEEKPEVIPVVTRETVIDESIYNIETLIKPESVKEPVSIPDIPVFTRPKTDTFAISHIQKAAEEVMQSVKQPSFEDESSDFESKFSMFSQYWKHFLGVIAVSAALYFGYGYFFKANDETFMAKLSEIAVLPAGETPKVYKIESETSEILKNPAFKGATTGDHVIVYESGRKVYIYRESLDKIVNIVTLSE